jgi:hypothetical protein
VSSVTGLAKADYKFWYKIEKEIFDFISKRETILYMKLKSYESEVKSPENKVNESRI